MVLNHEHDESHTFLAVIWTVCKTVQVKIKIARMIAGGGLLVAEIILIGA